MRADDRRRERTVAARSDACRPVIAHGTVSRRHAMLSRPPEGLEVRDPGSLNGTHVNGWRVDRALLRPGDTLSLGEVRVVVRAT